MKDLIGKTVAVRESLRHGSAGHSIGIHDRLIVGEVVRLWERNSDFFSVVTREGKTIDYLHKDAIVSVRP